MWSHVFFIVLHILVKKIYCTTDIFATLLLIFIFRLVFYNYFSTIFAFISIIVFSLTKILCENTTENPNKIISRYHLFNRFPKSRSSRLLSCRGKYYSKSSRIEDKRTSEEHANYSSELLLSGTQIKTCMIGTHD